MSTPAMVTVPTEPGIFPGLSFEHYVQIPAANHNLLKHFRWCAERAQKILVSPPDPNEAMGMGWCGHVATLEPARFELEFIPAIRADKRTNAGKAAWAEFTAAHQGRTIVTQEQYDLARGIRDAVWRHPAAAEILQSRGACELSVVWRHEGTGVLVKGRLDRLGELGGWPVVVDLKTTRDASQQAFAKDIYNYQYHEQAAIYLDGLDAHHSHPRKFLFIAVESAPPHCVAVYELEEDALQVGREAYEQHLAAYAACVRTGCWPGYGDGVGSITLPSWAFKNHWGHDAD
jgi:PDDEXK-like domain of unknown function (DUF3799)